jgi:hypothetical protein
MQVDIPYLICAFYVGEITLSIYVVKTSEVSWWATPFLCHHRVMGQGPIVCDGSINYWW